MIDHKIVCWGDYAIPVPLWANCMAWDEDGWCCVYSYEPRPEGDEWTGADNWVILTTDNILPPEPGPWSEQLYWIGD